MTAAVRLAVDSLREQSLDDVAYLVTLFREAVQNEQPSNASVIVALAVLVAVMDRAHPTPGDIRTAVEYLSHDVLEVLPPHMPGVRVV